eukprot:150025_1
MAEPSTPAASIADTQEVSQGYTDFSPIDESTWATIRSLNYPFQVYEIKQDVTLLGRQETSDITFENAAVSGTHCKIIRKPKKDSNCFDVYLRDYSTNGTYIRPPNFGRKYVTSKRIDKGKETPLYNGDRFCLIPKGDRRESIEFEFNILHYDSYQHYRMGRELGKGAFATVRLCTKGQEDKQYAMKIVDSKQYAVYPAKGKVGKKEYMEKRLHDEVEILSSIDHRNIVKFYDLFWQDDKMCIVLEYVPGGELFDLIKRLQRIPEERAKNIFRQMLSAVEYLHSKNICHRDLKPENILLMGGDSDEIKISDFGLSRLVGNASFMKTLCGTPQYVAPEVLNNAATDSTYTHKVDLWSLGVILYVMLSGTIPFPSESPDSTMLKNVMHGKFSFPETSFEGVSHSAIDLIKCLMNADPKERICGDELAKHPWLQKDCSFTKSKSNKRVRDDKRIDKHSALSTKKSKSLH